ncbi:MAG: DUF3102 domain-containing protein [Acidaminococcaceae bacterium]
MSELTIVRTPDVVAAEINAIKDQTRKIILSNSIEIGKRLCEAKEMVPYGEFGRWLEESVDYSQSTANNLMKIYDEYGASQGELFGASAKSQTLGKLSYSQAVVLLGVPAEEREAFAEDVDAGNLSVRQLQKQVEEYKTEKESLEKDIEESREIINTYMNGAQELLEEQKELKNKLKEEKKKASELQKQLSDNSQVDAEASAKLKEAEEKITALEAELAKPVTIEADSVEKIPEEVERELEELRAKAAQAELTQGEEAITKYKIHFEDLTKCFGTLMEDLANIQDQEKAAKFRGATIKLIDMMSEKLAQE